MPQYELMYILASQVADDQVPTIADEVKKTITTLGGNVIAEERLGKKKLAYPIKKTRNGHYVVVNFDMPGPAVASLEAKVRTQSASIIRFIIVNLEEHFRRRAKDVVAQAKLPKQLTDEHGNEVGPAPITTEELDTKIEQALTEDVTK